MHLLLLALLLGASDDRDWTVVPWNPGGVPNQMKAPCPTRAFTINGLCWGKVTKPVGPPCPAWTFTQWDGCYMPVVPVKKPPTS